MITIQSRAHVPGVRSQQVIEFLLRCNDTEYQRWWPGTHLRFHTLRRGPNDVGNTVFMDELVGKRRVKLTAVVAEVVPGKKIVWQWKALFRQPVRLVLELDEDATGVRITHTIRAGLEGFGRLLDPLFRLFFSADFERALDEHVRIEFPRLGALLGASIQGPA